MRTWIIAAAILALGVGAAEGRGGGHGGHGSAHHSSSKEATADPGYHYVSGYTKRDGTYVAPHYQTNPNGTRDDNWSTRGNVNPFTGQPGTKPSDEDLLYPH